MGPSELAELLHEGRDYAVRLTLSSGDEIVVPADVQIVIHGLTLVLPGAPRAGRVVSGPRLVSLPNIAVAEPLDHRPGSRRRRR
jgi:hypothetical protein